MGRRIRIDVLLRYPASLWIPEGLAMFICTCRQKHNLRDRDEGYQNPSIIHLASETPVPRMCWCIFAKDNNVILRDSKSQFSQADVYFVRDVKHLLSMWTGRIAMVFSSDVFVLLLVFTDNTLITQRSIQTVQTQRCRGRHEGDTTYASCM
jgi:hypothetical protein